MFVEGGNGRTKGKKHEVDCKYITCLVLVRFEGFLVGIETKSRHGESQNLVNTFKGKTMSRFLYVCRTPQGIRISKENESSPGVLMIPRLDPQV